ncbi:MAG: transcription-repair coupling factor, partial [Pseudomonadota bacterium]
MTRNAPAHVIISGTPEGFDAQVLGQELYRAEAPVIFVARDDKRLAAMAQALEVTRPELPRLAFPAWDCLPYDRSSPNPDLSAARMATLATLAQGAVPGPFVLLTTLNAFLQKIPARRVLREASFTAQVGGRVDEGALRAFLVRMGFVQAPTVTEPGDYAVRGGIIDVYPPGDTGPVRLDLFG